MGRSAAFQRDGFQITPGVQVVGALNDNLAAFSRWSQQQAQVSVHGLGYQARDAARKLIGVILACQDIQSLPGLGISGKVGLGLAGRCSLFQYRGASLHNQREALRQQEQEGIGDDLAQADRDGIIAPGWREQQVKPNPGCQADEHRQAIAPAFRPLDQQDQDACQQDDQADYLSGNICRRLVKGQLNRLHGPPQRAHHRRRSSQQPEDQHCCIRHWGWVWKAPQPDYDDQTQ